jgi:hypothetical protein
MYSCLSMTYAYEELGKDRSKDVEKQSGGWSWFNSQLYYVTHTEYCMRMFTHIQVGINFEISYMQSNLWRISPGGCFQKAGSAFPGFTRFIFGWIRVDHTARFLCCYFLYYLSSYCVVCAQCYHCLWVCYSWLYLRFFLTFIHPDWNIIHYMYVGMIL